MNNATYRKKTNTMTAVEWLIEQIMSSNIETYHELYDRFKKAKEMEKWQRMKFEIPELSDEEIIKNASIIFNTEQFEEKKIFSLACKWYREQLKQRQ